MVVASSLTFLLEIYDVNIRCFTFQCQAMCRDSRIVPGAAATEIELARKLKEFSFKETGYFFVSSSCCDLFAVLWLYLYQSREFSISPPQRSVASLENKLEKKSYLSVLALTLISYVFLDFPCD